MEFSIGEYVKEAGLMWLLGFREACCFQRVFFFCRSSRELSARTGKCFLLNGLIFLGSIFMLNSMVIPVLQWIIPAECQQFSPQDFCDSHDIVKLYAILHFVLIELFNIFWFYPLYVFSFVLSSIWYNEIAMHAFDALQRLGGTVVDSNDFSGIRNIANREEATSFGGSIIGIGEQVYSLILMSFFFLEVYATGFFPYVGKAINFLLLSWMYAYYSFEYKWNHSFLPLEKRLDLFQSNWAFFSGFGSPCVLAIFFFPPLVSYGVMAILFPLFVLTAIGSQAEKVIDSQIKSWRIKGLGKLPLFFIADKLAMKVLRIFQGVKKSDEGLRRDKKLQ